MYTVKTEKKGIFILAYKRPREELHWDSHHRIKELPWRMKSLSPLLVCSFPVNLKRKGKLTPAVLPTAGLGTAGQLWGYYIYHENFLSHKITQLSMIKSCSLLAKFSHGFQCRPSKSKTSGCIKQRLEISLLSPRNTGAYYVLMLMDPNSSDKFFNNYNLFHKFRWWERFAFFSPLNLKKIIKTQNHQTNQLKTSLLLVVGNSYCFIPLRGLILP